MPVRAGNQIEDYLFLDWHDILRLMQELTDEPDREVAHRGADHLLTVSLVKAACGEIDEGQARAIVGAYDEVERWFS